MSLAGKRLTYLMDSQFDDVAVRSTIWGEGQHLVCRLKHHEWTVELAGEDGNLEGGTVAEVWSRTRQLARVRTELLKVAYRLQ